MAEWAGLLIRCSGLPGPRVRIPLSPLKDRQPVPQRVAVYSLPPLPIASASRDNGQTAPTNISGSVSERPLMKLGKLFGPRKRKWRCPGCSQVFDVSNKQDDPDLCKSCLKQEKSRRRKEAFLAPFRFARNAVVVFFCLVVGGALVVAAYLAAFPPAATSNPHSSSGSGIRHSSSAGAASGETDGGGVKVKAYTRSDGTKVRAHTRSKPSKE